jgi:F420-non-reducing hydrogenase large subunit
MDLAGRGILPDEHLARVNVTERRATPLAQAELEEFRRSFGRPAQATLLTTGHG